MANPEQVQMLLRSVEEWNNWRKDNPDVIPDLYQASLCQANLREADLSRVNLREADLQGADLCHSNLRGADLREANNIPWNNFFGAQVWGLNTDGAT